MVLDAGRLVEFDTPKNLLVRRDSDLSTENSGFLRSLVEGSEDKAKLYVLAGLGPDGRQIS